MATKNRRIQVMLPKELEEMLQEIRDKDVTCRYMSDSALAQMLMWRGIEVSKATWKSPA